MSGTRWQKALRRPKSAAPSFQPTSIAAEKAKVADLREKLVQEKVLHKQQKASSNELTRQLIQAERGKYEMEMDNRRLMDTVEDTDQKYLALDDLRMRQVKNLSEKLEEAESHLVQMLQHISRLEKELGETQVSGGRTKKQLEEKLEEITLDRDKLLEHCDSLMKDNLKEKAKRADIIQKLDEEARRRLKVEATCSELDAELRVAVSSKSMLETRVSVEVQQNREAEANVEAMKRDLKAVKLMADDRIRKLEEENRALRMKWSEAEENYEGIYKLQQQEIDHLSLKLQAARLGRP